MRKLPSRLRRLDDALADLPLEEPMLLTELDGFLTGILVSPDPIEPDEWLKTIWGSDDGDVAPFDDPLDVQWFVDAVTARYDEVARDLGRGKPQPIFDIDDRNGDVRWELWVDGFTEAMDLRPAPWATLADGDDPEAADALSELTMLIAISRDESPLDSIEINAFQERATEVLADAIVGLYAARERRRGTPATTAIRGRAATTIGRNDPCTCGSGKKSKRCCEA